MKGFILTIVLAIGVAVGVFAKNPTITAHFGVGGSTWNTNVGSVGSPLWNGKKAGMDPLFAYRLGVAVDFYGKRAIGFQTGLNFEGGGASTGVDSNYDLSMSVRQLYLELPLMATARINLSDKLGLIFNLGPYFGIGVGGKTKLSGSLDGISTSVKTNTFGEKVDLNRFDAGIGAGVVLEIQKHYLVGFDSRMSYVNLLNSDIYDKDDKARNYFGYFVFGYKF